MDIKGKEKQIGIVMAIVLSVLGGLVGFNVADMKQGLCEQPTVVQPAVVVVPAPAPAPAPVTLPAAK